MQLDGLAGLIVLDFVDAPMGHRQRSWMLHGMSGPGSQLSESARHEAPCARLGGDKRRRCSSNETAVVRVRAERRRPAHAVFTALRGPPVACPLPIRFGSVAVG